MNQYLTANGDKLAGENWVGEVLWSEEGEGTLAIGIFWTSGVIIGGVDDVFPGGWNVGVIMGLYETDGDRIGQLTLSTWSGFGHWGSAQKKNRIQNFVLAQKY